MDHGTRSEYLANLASAFPERDSHGYVIGYYVYTTGASSQRLTDAFPTRRAAECDEAVSALLRVGFAKIVVGYVTTAKGTLVREDVG